MRAQLSNRDYEQLSAYIDGQLTPADKRKLEERLRVHTDLQAALDEMSRTRALLRSAPRRRAPRNFTLSPAMVGARKQGRSGPWWNLFPVLSFTSALATLALVATILFQLLPAQKAAETAAMQQPQADRVADIVQRTMTAMQATAPARQNAPLQSGQALSTAEGQSASPQAEKQVAPTATPPLTAPLPEGTSLPQATEQPLVSAPQATQPPEGTATAQPAAAASVQTAPETTPTLEQPALGITTQSNPPVIGWGNNTGPAGVTGMGGGDGQGAPSGTLLGPPAAAAPNVAMGKGGGGGGSGQPVTGQNIVIPQESVNSQDSTTPSQTQVSPNEQPAPAQVNPAITGTGPILGVPAQGEGGQIVEKKAILGQPDAAPQPQLAAPLAVPGEEPGRTGVQSSPETRPQTLFGLPAMVVLQALLALIAVGAGAAALIIRKQAR